MLASDNRVTQAIDFRSVVRSGLRFATPHSVLHVLRREPSEPTRFGFIVSKAVGGAVQRNRVRRRLRALCREVLPDLGSADVVIRALPGCGQASWGTLHSEIAPAIRKAVG